MFLETRVGRSSALEVIPVAHFVVPAFAGTSTNVNELRGDRRELFCDSRFHGNDVRVVEVTLKARGRQSGQKMTPDRTNATEGQSVKGSEDLRAQGTEGQELRENTR
jgi:hypothetical protein